ncbi:putative serine protease PepD [Nocardioides aurantiacus]|uniref:Putative serine protease PepD n=1 Tax=Nocardioides aurantiacus TaxID=86796 RepID=A0A3N2CY00_9ACTN|nr:putative serine protease PepD [Nocardioides aurantiacus]
MAATPPGPSGPWGPPPPSYAEPTRRLPGLPLPPADARPDDRGFLGGALAEPEPDDSAPTRAGLPRWVWPAVAGLALVLGLTGGALAAGLMAQDGEQTSISVERRTAQPLPADNASIASVAEEVLPSTVQILAGAAGAGSGGATGSGFVYDDQGHVITNNHVVAEAAEAGQDIRIVDQDGNRSVAKVVGRSTVYDLAVLEAEGARSMQPAAVGSADQMRVGETVVAIGSPLGLSSTVTSGIISAVNRPVTTGESQSDNSYINAVQTDAAINPGNSGGPLVNLQGQVVGVNSAIASLGSVSGDQGGNIGVGFAIPIEQVEVTAAQILRSGKAQYPVIGANVRGLPSLDGARVEEIDRGSPAADADLEVGDVIRRVDDALVTTSIDLVVAIRSHVPGEEVTLSVTRGGRDFSVPVTLDAKTE